jgi:hypothetical protein
MGSLYALQRANGDWFALEDHGRLRVPLFHNSTVAMHARGRHPEMFLFKPTVFDQYALKGLALEQSKKNISFLLVDDPLISLRRGRQLEHTELELANSRDELPDRNNGRNSNG